MHLGSTSLHVEQTAAGHHFYSLYNDLDGEVVMRVGGGKKHVRFWIGDGTIDTASTLTLSQIRARSTGSSPAIRPRSDSTWFQVNALQVISVLFIVH